ncbi:hypothetical protein F5Y05DRAFT_307667 [Hypoxylon sp. FL0543]|nr:hypothetical protein F5Y05DRAFT_307667 [Hypoxylon sp. FL0543]
MATGCLFLDLPRELRDIIYEYYVSDGGYIFDFETGRLRTTEGYPINLALTFTCRQVASEMNGIALRNNTIFFHAIRLEEKRKWPHSYPELLRISYALKRIMFRCARSCFTADLKSRVAQVYPDFMPAFDLTDVEHQWDAGGAGFAPSVIHSATDYALDLASSHPSFPSAMSEFRQDPSMDWEGIEPDHEALNSLRYQPWSIPTEALTRRVAIACGYRQLRTGRRPNGLDSIRKHNFSAAAACIQFLESIPIRIRSEIRSIILDEDLPGIARQADHARGLIPFCQENPSLRVKRHANLWRNVFLYGLIDDSHPLSRSNSNFQSNIMVEQLSTRMTEAVSLWTVETLALISAGMPPDSFCLILDGNPVPVRSSEIFQQIVKRHASWQAVMEECIKRGFINRFNLLQNEEFRYDCYFYKQFPEAFDNIVNKRTSIVRCNFDMGTYSLSDLEHQVEERRGWTLRQWRNDWYSLVSFIDLFPSIRDFTDILDELRRWTPT